jgi:hypothetical protein
MKKQYAWKIKPERHYWIQILNNITSKSSYRAGAEQWGPNLYLFLTLDHVRMIVLNI